MEPVIIKQAEIVTPNDFTDLEIVDWNRWRYGGLASAMASLPRWLISCWYTVIEYDLGKEPLRDGFDWGHYGAPHHHLGHQYWSFFQRAFPGGEITFSDAPDFSGFFLSDDGVKNEFIGDIGQVSASAFFLNALPHFHKGTLWITVHTNQQIIIESSYDIEMAIRENVGRQFGFAGPHATLVAGPTELAPALVLSLVCFW